MKLRQPAQAGSFYADSEGALRTQIQNCFLKPPGPCIMPSVPAESDETLCRACRPPRGLHLLWPSGRAQLQPATASGPRKSIVILGPNHTGLGSGVSTMTAGQWSTPLGEVKVDSELAKNITENSRLIDVEDGAHKFEHSVEVQLPFLQFIYPRQFQFVPICMMLQDLKTSKDVGEAMARALAGKRAVMIASSDWTHYEPHDEAVTKDMEALRVAMEMDPQKFQTTIEEKMVSACGCGPVTAVMHASKILGAKKSQLLSYKTSGDITGDKKAVVAYAALSFTM